MPRTLPARLLLGLAMLAGLILRVRLTDDGIYWPDEIYQSFEPAHKLVFGYGIIPWEYIQGARTWALPGVIALVIKLTAMFGGDSPTVYIPVVKLVFVAASLATVLGVYRLSQVIQQHSPEAELASAAAASVWALCSAALYFAPRAMSENASAATVMWGLVLVLDHGNTSRRLMVLGASLLGLSVLFRLQTAIFCITAVTMLWWRARSSTSTGVGASWKLALAVLTGWALVYGLLDAISWHAVPEAKLGGLFHSVFVYVRFNIIEGQGAKWGTAPWQYYAKHLWSTMPAVTLVLLISTIVSFRRAMGLVITAFAFVAIHAAVAHKELRFLLPVLPVLCALIGPGLTTLARIPALRAALPATVLIAVASAWSAPSLTMGDLGAYLERPASSAWNDFANINRLLLAASKRPDVCGLRIDAAHLAWTGGSTYFHHPVPLYMPGYPANRNHFNYAIVQHGSGAQIIAEENGLDLVYLPQVTCQPDTGYSWRLP